MNIIHSCFFDWGLLFTTREFPTWKRIRIIQRQFWLLGFKLCGTASIKGTSGLCKNVSGRLVMLELTRQALTDRQKERGTVPDAMSTGQRRRHLHRGTVLSSDAHAVVEGDDERHRLRVKLHLVGVLPLELLLALVVQPSGARGVRGVVRAAEVGREGVRDELRAEDVVVDGEWERG